MNSLKRDKKSITSLSLFVYIFLPIFTPYVYPAICYFTFNGHDGMQAFKKNGGFYGRCFAKYSGQYFNLQPEAF